MKYPKITLVSHGGGNFLQRKLLGIKSAFTEKIQKAIPEPQSALLGGLLLGAKHSLDQNLLEDFRRAGVIHIVVLSGYNVTIVAQFIMALCSFLPKFIGFSFGILGIILFVLMTGAATTTIRSSVMAILGMIAAVSYRQYNVSRALFIAAYVMVIWNPRIVFSDPSFQLSFMATFGLIYFSPIVEKKIPIFKFFPEKFQIRQLAVSTITTQIFLLPFLLYQTGMISLVALIVNLLILAPIPFTMLMGLVTGLLTFVSPLLALPFGFVAYLILSYILIIVQFFAHVPFAAISINYFPFWLVISAYLLYGWGILSPNR